MNRVRAADDYKAIRLRMEELQRERGQRLAGGGPAGGGPAAKRSVAEPDAAAHGPRHIVRRHLADGRRPSSR